MKNKNASRMQAIWLLSVLFMSVLSQQTYSANNPGHDSLYVLKIGDNMTGNLNITGSILSSGIKSVTVIQGNYLDIWANETSSTPKTVSSYPTIQALGNKDLYLDSVNNMYIATLGGTSGFVKIGSATVNITGTLYTQNQLLCLANGTNCPSSLSNANITGYGVANNLSKWSSGSNLVSSIIYDSGTNIGIGDASPASKLSVNGNMSITGNISVAGSIVCTAANGLCNTTTTYQSNASGWTNTTTQITTTLNVNMTGNLTIDNGLLFINSATNMIGINTTSPTQMLDINGNVNITGNLSITGAGDCLILPSGGKVCGNSTCTYMVSPNGLTTLQACN